MADRGPRLGARVLDSIAALVLVIAALVVLGDGERPYAGLAIAWFVVWAYDALTTACLGATPGKLLVGLKVVALDQTGRVPPATAAKRGAVDAAFTVLPVIGWGIWLSSTLTGALGRGVADRAAVTMVVPKATALPIASADLAGYADGARAPRRSRFGRVGDLDVRARARLRRLVDAPLLAAAIGLLALAVSLPFSTALLIVGSSVAWVVLFVLDETRRVHRTGTTAGHRLAGLVIRDGRTGQPPSTGRSFARALVLGLTLYVPPLWLILGLPSVLMIRFGETGRGLHDLAGGTWVVADPTLDPELQRQRSMRMRLGQAAT
ncbi:RDD family protein [Aquihabitans sp. G128]|uniref:RDD family protein n=1 Tax=Aquihabitans sp. G128 TaxID=2849779 RepID=UPI001C241BD7|nr:RDD family protein [Aquihabitans sp. G128]QXC62161.1 RDD family protein [Aquihabitans sp. G128]